MLELTNTGYTTWEHIAIDEQLTYVEAHGTDLQGNIIRNDVGHYRDVYTWEGKVYVLATRWNPDQTGTPKRSEEQRFDIETTVDAQHDAELWIANGYFTGTV